MTLEKLPSTYCTSPDKLPSTGCVSLDKLPSTGCMTLDKLPSTGYVSLDKLLCFSFFICEHREVTTPTYKVFVRIK